MMKRLIQPLFPKIRSAYAFGFFELFIQVAGVVKTAAARDFFQCIVRKPQKFFCLRQSFGNYILIERRMAVMTEFPGKMVFA